MKHWRPAPALLWSVLASSALAAQAGPADADLLAKALETPVAIVQGRVPDYTLTLKADYTDGEIAQGATLRIAHAADGRFALSFEAPIASFLLERRKDAIRLIVPARQVAFVGRGPLRPDSELQPSRLFLRMAAAWPVARTAAAVFQTAEPGAVALMMQMLLKIEREADAELPTFTLGRKLGGGTLSLVLVQDASSFQAIRWRAGRKRATLRIEIEKACRWPDAPETAGLKTLNVPRDELERTLGRGLPQVVHILAYNHDPPRLPRTDRHEGKGRLVVRDGQRLAMLQGSAYEIGYQHGRLLRREARRVSDGALYVVGLYYSLAQRRWFLDEIRSAFRRLEPHIPPEYLEEMKGLADGAGLELEEVQLTNVFPALFHCSGFALFGRATADGSLYHGRVLDYMTEVALQREAVVFVVRKDGAIPFANVGYAGFIGSVSGMNAEQVAFGEMGGGGVGDWDGTPMPILMRMGLERAHTLAHALELFRRAKRTCEYYYVISDGKGPAAAGVRATPEVFEVIGPGQAHPRLPTPVQDAVVLSAGSRYAALVGRIRKAYGKIDEKTAMGLMRRPVAMKSNLHDVLFVPQKLRFYVANARGRHPACDQPYRRYDLRAILAEMAARPDD